MKGQVIRLLFFSIVHICDLLIYLFLLIRFFTSTSSSLYPYVIPALTIIGGASVASFIHALHDAKQHRSLLPTLPGGVYAWLPASLLCAIPPASSALSMIFFLVRAVVGTVGRDFRSSLVVVSEDAADAQFCLHAFLQSAPLLALNFWWAASRNRVSAPLLLATLSSLLHVYAGIFMGRGTNVQLYFAWFFVDYDGGGGATAAPADAAAHATKKLRLFAALISVCFRFWCVSVVATTSVASAVFASHRHWSLIAVALLAAPHLFFLCFEVVWKLFAHRLFAFLKEGKRRGVFLFLLFLLCLTTTGVNVLFSAAWIVDVKRNDLELPSRFCPKENGGGATDRYYFPTTAASDAGDGEGRRNNDYVGGIPSFVWPNTASAVESTTACISPYLPRPDWAECDVRSLFRNGTLVEDRRWWNRVNWTTDLPALWRSEALFCLNHVAEPLFLCLFYANICQILVLALSLIVFASWKLIVFGLARKGGGGGGGTRMEKLNGNYERESSFGVGARNESGFL